MTAITFDKTWAAEEKIISSSLTIAEHFKEGLFQIKTLLKNHNWTHFASCDGTSVSTDPGTDLWVDRTDVVNATPGNAHSWIVLKNTAIASNFQVCFDINSGTNAASIGVQVSYNSGFTGGTTTARPTATDETVILGSPSAAWISLSAALGIVITMYYSSDFTCNRIFLNVTDPAYDTTTYGGCFIFDIPKNPVSWWANPFFCIAGLGCLNYTKHNNASNTNAYTKIDSVSTKLCLGSLGFSTGAYGASGYGDSQDYNGAYIVSPVPLISVTVARPGILGMMYDSYWVSSTIKEGTYIPTTAGSRRLFVMGNMAQANDGNKRSI